MKGRKPLPPTYIFAAIVLMLALHFLLPVKTLIGFPWRLTGIVPMLIGVWLNLAADGTFKKRNTTVKPFEESAVLVTDGVYRITRNPMYLGFVLILAGIWLLMGTLTPVFVLPVFAAAMEFVFIRSEEKMLAAKFGDDWTAYKSKVRKWI